MNPQALSLLVILTILWFVAFWIIGGIIFAIVGLVSFLRLNKNRFSCLFTIFSGLAAFGGAWMGLLAAHSAHPFMCLPKGIPKNFGITASFPNLFSCAYQEVLSAAGLWFLFLLAAGIILLFVSRTPEHPRDIHGNN